MHFLVTTPRTSSVEEPAGSTQRSAQSASTSDDDDDTGAGRCTKSKRSASTHTSRQIQPRKTKAPVYRNSITLMTSLKMFCSFRSRSGSGRGRVCGSDARRRCGTDCRFQMQETQHVSALLLLALSYKILLISHNMFLTSTITTVADTHHAF